jgi:hypothetical protein
VSESLRFLLEMYFVDPITSRQKDEDKEGGGEEEKVPSCIFLTISEQIDTYQAQQRSSSTREPQASQWAERA